jgi:hypothetical protein
MTEKTPSDGRLVQLPGGWFVPPEFTVQLGAIHHSESYTVAVEMRGTRSHVRFVGIIADGDPLSPERLDEISLAELVDAAVQQVALRYTPRKKFTLSEVEEMGGRAIADVIEADLEHAHRAATSARRRRVTPERLAEVVELHEQGGVGAIMDTLHYSERNARRLLARAREAGLR